MFGRKYRQHSSGIGCGFMLLTGIVIIAMLILNTLFVRAFFSLNLTGIDERMFQSGQFVLPIIMIFIEFWFYDFLVFRRRSKKQRNAQIDD